MCVPRLMRLEPVLRAMRPFMAGFVIGAATMASPALAVALAVFFMVLLGLRVVQ
jgi:hypothetical protein